MAKNGGALQSLKRIVNLGLGGTVGSEKQDMSWIHEFDMNECIYQAIINTNYNGFYIASSPNPVSNLQFMGLLRKKMNFAFGLSAPEFITRIGAKLIFKTDPELALYSRYVRFSEIDKLGFQFKYPDFNSALDNLI